MIIGSRVQFIEDNDTHKGALGTVTKLTPVGYTHVEWDDGTCGDWSPRMVPYCLRICEGDDALPRHQWKLVTDDIWRCEKCGVEQTDENEFGACK